MEDDKGSIKRDGLLIVHRSRRDLLLGELQELDEVVEIKDGVAKLPHKWTLASVWLVAIYFPVVPVVSPHEVVSVLPLVSEYTTVNLATQNLHLYRTLDSQYLSGGENPRIHMLTIPAKCLAKQNSCLQRILSSLQLGLRPGKKNSTEWQVICLRERDFEKVRAFIEKELREVDTRTTSQPATQQRDDEIDHVIVE